MCNFYYERIYICILLNRVTIYFLRKIKELPNSGELMFRNDSHNNNIHYTFRFFQFHYDIVIQDKS